MKKYIVIPKDKFFSDNVLEECIYNETYTTPEEAIDTAKKYTNQYSKTFIVLCTICEVGLTTTVTELA